ncbi:phage holin family protein, partial [Pseudarthrobacter sp. C1]|uniref:phage holin family protein n=1 Tax=Pseudarthrobacter sp. C1 TaxID=3108940 RepID=UPI002B05A58F
MPPSEAHLKAENASLGELLGDVTRDLSTLMRQEVELAKAELKQSATKAGKGSGMLAGAGVAGHFVLVFLSLALM